MSDIRIGVVETLRRAAAYARFVQDCLRNPTPTGRFRVPDEFRGVGLPPGMVDTRDPSCNVQPDICMPTIQEDIGGDRLLEALDRLVVLQEHLALLVHAPQVPQR